MIWQQVGGSLKLHTGTRVVSVDDPRLGVGRVEAVCNSAFVKVKWEETSWFSWLSIEDVERAR